MARLFRFRRLTLGFVVLLALSGLLYEGQRVSSAEPEATAADTDDVGERVDTEADRSPASLPADYRKTALLLAHRINRVTVYSDRAEITRTAEATVKPGTQWVHFAGLPNNLDRATFRVQAPGFNGQLHQVLIEESFEHTALTPEIQNRLTHLRQWYGDLLDLMQQEMILSHYLGFVQGLRYNEPFKREPASQVYRSFSAKVDTLKSSMDEIQRESAILSTKLYGVREKMHGLSEQIDQVSSQLHNVTQTSDQKWVVHAYALLQSATTQKVPLEVSYQISEAHWRPVYDVRTELDRGTGTAAIRLVTAAMVEQHTGEDWKGVHLTLSTLDPSPLYLPKLDRWVLSEVRVAKEPAPKRSRVAEDEEDRGGTYGDMKKKARVASANKPASIQAAQTKIAEPSVTAPSAAPASPPPVAEAGKDQDFGRNVGGAGAGGAANGMLAQKSEMSQSGYRASARAKGGRRDELKALDKATVADGLSSDAPAGESTASLFPLAPMEEVFPAIAEIDTTLASLRDAQPQYRVFEQRGRVDVPQPIAYQDSSLPAVQAAGRLLEFTSPFLIDLKSDEPALKTPVHQQMLRGELSYFAVPKADAKVFLRAKTRNTTDHPILGAPAQVFMDGDLVSKTQIGTLSEGSFFDIDLGPDRNVETKRVVTKQAKTSGLIRKSHVTDVDVKIEIANHHPFPVTMEIKDNYPLSPGDKVTVEEFKFNPEPAKNKDGILSWELSVPAHKKVTLSFSYQISHPENFIVSEFD